ncbi:MAG: class I SAM-dependent methyltransferase [Acidobacteriota bacterium]
MAWERLEGFYGLAGTSQAERDALLAVIPQTGFFLEIGSADGVTVSWLASRRPQVAFLSVDPYPPEKGNPSQSEGLTNWWRNRRENQRLLLGTSEDLHAFLHADQVDVALVDGLHDYQSCKDDLFNCAGRLEKIGSVLAAHDYERRRTVIRAVQDFQLFHPGFEVIEVVRWTILMRRVW